MGGERGRELRGGYYLQQILDSLSFHSQLFLSLKGMEQESYVETNEP